MNDPKSAPSPTRIQIQLDEATAQGKYANLVMVNANENEFVLDFVFVQPQQPVAKVSSRIILTPKQTKQLLGALAENVAVYERRFGPIGTPLTPPPDSQLH